MIILIQFHVDRVCEIVEKLIKINEIVRATVAVEIKVSLIQSCVGHVRGLHGNRSRKYNTKDCKTTHNGVYYT